jgi:hypothetical protein
MLFAEESLLLLNSKPREIPRFARNDKQERGFLAGCSACLVLQEAEMKKRQAEACPTERASAPRFCRDAGCALATGQVALAGEEPSQGRRSLSRFPASGLQGFGPVELNLFWAPLLNPW